MTRLSHLIVCVVLGLAVQSILASCATQQQQAKDPVKLVWPPSPLPKRIEFVRSIVSDEDLNQDTTFSQKVVNFLAGEKPPPNRLVEPMGLAVSDDGQIIYVSDVAHSAVFVFDFANKKFNKIEALARPTGLALDANQNLYVVEQARKRVSVFDREFKPIRWIADPSVKRPNGIAIDRQRGKIYVADTAHNNSKEHTVKVFSLDGKLIGTVGRGKGMGPGEFLFPTYLAVDQTGNLYVTDSLNARVQMFDPSGKYVRRFGERGDAWGMFDVPKGLALDTFGNLYVADSGWSNVQIFNRKGKVLLFFGGRGPIPGMLKNPTAIAIDKSNHIYVGDYLNHRVEEYRLVNTTVADSFVEPVVTAKGGDSGAANEQVASHAPAPQRSD